MFICCSSLMCASLDLFVTVVHFEVDGTPSATARAWPADCGLARARHGARCRFVAPGRGLAVSHDIFPRGLRGVGRAIGSLRLAGRRLLCARSVRRPVRVVMAAGGPVLAACCRVRRAGRLGAAPGAFGLAGRRRLFVCRISSRGRFVLLGFGRCNGKRWQLILQVCRKLSLASLRSAVGLRGDFLLQP